MKDKLYQIIFEAETPGGKIFDLVLLWVILFSVITVILESVYSLNVHYGHIFNFLEWFFIFIFTVEYITRILIVKKPLQYIFSFYGLIDLFAILPGLVSLFFPFAESLLIIRGFRLLRVFRLFKLARYVGEADILLTAIWASRFKVTVFLVTVVGMAITVGAAMYLIEGGENGFTSIPRGVYWAIVTMTTVGYGDLAPQTPAGQFLASLVMILGYGIIAVPTGIISVEIAEAHKRAPKNTRVCPHCMLEGHAMDANFCRACGEALPPT